MRERPRPARPGPDRDDPDRPGPDRDDPVTLVLGSSGMVGRRVARRLRAAGVETRTASRSGPVPFDWARPGTWAEQLAGVRSLFLVSPEGVAVEPGFVRLAVERGVQRVVLLSDRGLEVMEVQRLVAAEALVRDSGVPWTIVRPDWFDQDFDESFFRPAVLAGLVTVPVGDVRQGFVDAEDIAAVVVAALTEPGHEGRTYELTGPSALSFTEAVGLIAARSGRQVRFAGDATTYRRAREELGVAREHVETELAHYAALAALGDTVPSGDVTRVLGRPARAFADYVADAAARGAWVS